MITTDLDGVGNGLRARSRHPIRVIVVDDHPVVRFGLEAMFAVDDQIDLVAQLSNAEHLIEALAATPADIILLDLELDRSSGVEALQSLRSSSEGVRVIVYTAHSDDVHILRSIEIGVDGYLLKGCRPEVLVRAIHTVFMGESALDPTVAARIMKHMHKKSSREAQTRSFGFSAREKQVLQLLAAGRTNREIGKRLCISESTVKFHMHSILEKLNASNRTEAVLIAARNGLVEMRMAPEPG